MDINVPEDLKKYHDETENMIKRLQQVEQERAILIQGIHERNGILIYLKSKETPVKD